MSAAASATPASSSPGPTPTSGWEPSPGPGPERPLARQLSTRELLVFASGDLFGGGAAATLALFYLCLLYTSRCV